MQLIVPRPGEVLGRPGLSGLGVFGQDHGPVVGPGGVITMQVSVSEVEKHLQSENDGLAQQPMRL